MFCLEHYIVVVMGVIAATVISGLLVTMIETLYQRAIEQGKTISRQNEDLQITVDEQTRFLVSSNESLRELAYLTSHDLREPLRSISGFVSLIKKNSDSNTIEQNRKEVNEYFDYVQRGVKQMEELINDIKEFSSINILEKNFSVVNMNELIHLVSETLESEITRTAAIIRIQQNIPDIFGDKTLLLSLFQNLITNAIKYQHPTIKPQIDINYQSLKGYHLFSVKDNGIGIPDEYQQRIFLAFKRLHGKESMYEGTGLGLAICKKIIEIHNGEIWIESKPDQGSTFFFTLRGEPATAAITS
jgi:light-regulated signal transduction histidine kinase (bacteriophytochrome)